MTATLDPGARPASQSNPSLVTGRYAPVDLDPLLPLVEKPQRYAGGERQTYNKPLTDEAVKWALCFPEAYEIGMSHLGLKILYYILNETEGIVCDRAYCPWIDMEALMRRRDVKSFAHESRAALDVFDVLGFSIQYELTYGNVLTMLDLAGIPLRASERRDDHPIVLGGGPCMANPEPLAPFFDAFVIGDGEEVVHDVSDTVRRLRGQRRELLVALAQIPGIYVPSLYDVDYDGGKIAGFRRLDERIPERVQRIWVENLAEIPYPTNPVVPLAEIVQDRYAVEVVRGCTQSCRFCQAGYWYRPVRERPVEQVVELAKEGVRQGGFDDVSLISLSTADHSQVDEMTRGVADVLKDGKVSLSLPSLRADSFSVGLAEAAGEVKKNGFTFAPETGSERLRRVINKNITDASLLEAVGTAYERGWNLIKLYFMIGIPSEDMDDVASIASLTRKVSEVGKRVGGGKRVTAAVGAHVPKAFTPFQWEAFDGIERLGEKLDFLKRKLPRSRFVRLKWHDLQPSYLEAVFALGDRRAGEVIESAWRHGARFDGWGEQFNMEPYTKAFAETGVDPRWYVDGRDLDDILPWDLLDASLTKKFLLRERRKGFEERLTNDCRWGDCHMCGIPGAPDDIKLSVDLPEAQGVSGKLGLDGNLVRKAGYARRIKIEPAAAEPAAQLVDTSADTAKQTSASTSTAKAGVAGALVTSPRDDRSAAASSGTAPGEASGAASGEATGAASGDTAVTMRVRYAIDGPSRFAPHGDVVRAFQRACRVAEIPVRFSQGFTPRPKMSFCPPLPVGLAGLREAFDVELQMPVDALAERMNAVLPPGIAIVDAFELAERGVALNSDVRGADYEARLPAELVQPALDEKIEAFHAASSLEFTKRRPNKADRVIDLKRAVVSLARDGESVRFRLAMRDPEGHETRAQTVLEHVLGFDRETAARVLVTRQALLTEDGTVV